MAINFSVKSTDTLFIDTNIFIYALEDNGQLGNISRGLLTQVKQKNPTVFTSVLTIEEILTGVFKENLEAKIPQYLEFVSGGGLITILEFDQNTSIVCARLRSQYNLKTPDAIQVSCALACGAKYYLTAVKRIPKRIGEIKIVNLS